MTVTALRDSLSEGTMSCGCSMNEGGVGLSRDNAFMRVSGDILLFIDDDEVVKTKELLCTNWN